MQLKIFSVLALLHYMITQVSKHNLYARVSNKINQSINQELDVMNNWGSGGPIWLLSGHDW